LKERDISQVGLGLAFCKMVVEAHGGQIFVDANGPKGSVFSMEI
jgi:signal transduction histidine kinase